MRASLALALVALSAAAPAADLGTLFFTAKEREQLERLRLGETPQSPTIARPDPVITGYVKRSDGKSTVFIDKQPVPVRNPRLERRLEPRAVDRFDPLPMPPDPAASEGVEPADKPVAAKAQAGPAAELPKAPASPKRDAKGG